MKTNILSVTNKLKINIIIDHVKTLCNNIFKLFPNSEGVLESFKVPRKYDESSVKKFH